MRNKFYGVVQLPGEQPHTQSGGKPSGKDGDSASATACNTISKEALEQVMRELASKEGTRFGMDLSMLG